MSDPKSVRLGGGEESVQFRFFFSPRKYSPPTLGQEPQRLSLVGFAPKLFHSRPGRGWGPPLCVFVSIFGPTMRGFISLNGPFRLGPPFKTTILTFLRIYVTFSQFK
ncbi:hypothetical protein TNIN_98531 [Trichonephila inaurata madagascariensis]|uniref:Uncharacterized protein n=1 Tax=Trichonephila inaurata madagascariensis TaxID=2747483 RepID=A0A8X7CAY0_9ARAC|nr:hypothetical protein TNIN_98531 [Trichonephila inaurata madagascariensis]